MYFTDYNPLSRETVLSSLHNKLKADGNACDALSGKTISLRLNGEYAPSQLDYIFQNEGELTVTENGKTYNAPYSAIALGHVVVFTHSIPDTDRAWHVVVDMQTYAVTAYETWFGISVPVGPGMMEGKEPHHFRDIPREVQREYYFGYAQTESNEKPVKLHMHTNHMECRGMHWAYSTGQEFLTFFPSILCSTYVELSDPRGDITITNPSDYIKIDDEFYIFSRWDVEFSGRAWIEVMNFYKMEAVGIEYGFDDNDSFVYRTHRAKIKVTGDAAHLEMMNNYGNAYERFKAPKGIKMKSQKGQRYAYRPHDYELPMTHEEALAKAKETQFIFVENGPNVMMSANMLPYSNKLSGRRFSVCCDGQTHPVAPWAGEGSPVYEYEIIGRTTLKWRFEGSEWHEEQYRTFEVAENLFSFSHMLSGEADCASVVQAIDFNTGLTTTMRSQIGNWQSPWEIGSRVLFGTLKFGDMVPPFGKRHHFTQDFLGKSIAWAYSDTSASIHVYSSPFSSSWSIFQGDNSGGPVWSSPCFFIKLRDDVYMFQWIEERCNGFMSTVFINTNTRHDSGFAFGLNHKGLLLDVMGAFGRPLGQFDIKDYFL